MASNLKPWVLSLLLFFSCSLSLTLTSSQPTMQRNIETFFPSLSSPAFNTVWPPPPPPSPSSTDASSVTKAVAATAVSSFVFCGLLFFVFQFFVVRRRRRKEMVAQPAKSPRLQRLRSKANLAMRRSSVFVDDDGLDAVYWREFNKKICDHCNKGFYPRKDEGEEHGGPGEVAPPPIYDRRIQEKPLLPVGSVNSSSSSSESFRGRSSFPPRPTQVNQQLPPPPNQRLPPAVGRVVSSAPRPPLPQNGSPWSPPTAPPETSNTGLPPPPGRVVSSAPRQPLPQNGSPWSPPTPPPATSNTRPPPPSSQPPRPPATPPPETKPNAAVAPPPPLPPVKKTNAAPAPPPPPPPAKPGAKPPPPPPPRPNNKTPAAAAPPPPPPGGSRPGGASSSRPPPPPAAAAAEGGAKKLKPLHWDKVNAINVEHSMVWDKITDGSFNVDEGMMEALFGAMAIDRKAGNNSGDPSTSRAGGISAAAAAQINLLDPHKSQNIAIVLRSLAISRQDILDGIVEGRGLSADVLERLTKISPTKEDEDLVRGYTGDPSKLTDAESFLFHILRAVPAPFARLDAMFFRSNYEPEVAHLKQSLHTLEQACKELRTPTRGLFLKLLETVLKAGNRMNAGTARGNAQAFNLAALRKLADVKSTDGSTTLLHFVVEEVVRSEGKRLVVNRNHSLRHSNSGAAVFERTTSRREDREKEYVMLGLPIVGGLSDEFASLKKAAGIDYDALITTNPTLQARVTGIRRLLETCGVGGFAREMKAFVEAAEKELKTARGEQVQVLELVKKTTEYYHPGASNARDAHPLQLFMIVKDFLDMVDKACVDIARNLQKKKQQPAAAASTARSESGSTSSESGSRKGSERGRRPMARFPNLPPHFLSGNSKSDSSSDED